MNGIKNNKILNHKSKFAEVINMIAFSIMMWFVSIILVFLSISLLRGNYASVHGKVLDSTDDKEGYAKALGKPILLLGVGISVAGTTKNSFKSLKINGLGLFYIIGNSF